MKSSKLELQKFTCSQRSIDDDVGSSTCAILHTVRRGSNERYHHRSGRHTKPLRTSSVVVFSPKPGPSSNSPIRLVANPIRGRYGPPRSKQPIPIRFTPRMGEVTVGTSVPCIRHRSVGVSLWPGHGATRRRSRRQ